MVRHLESPQWLNTEFRSCEMDLVFKKLIHWPTTCLLPVVDLWRVIALHSQSHNLHKGSDEGFHLIAQSLKCINKEGGPLAVVAIRYLANLFEYPTNRSAVVSHRRLVVEGVTSGLCSSNSNVRLGGITVLLNMAIAFGELKKVDTNDRTELLRAICSFLSKETDEECYYRGLVTAGTLLSQDGIHRGFDEAVKQELLAVLPRHNKSAPEAERIRSCSQDIETVISR